MRTMPALNEKPSAQGPRPGHGGGQLMGRTNDLLPRSEVARLPQLKIVACPGLSDRANNPYTWLIHGPMRDRGGIITEFSFYRPLEAGADILHVHWPERIFWGRISRLHPMLSAAYARRMLAAMDRVRRGGGFVVWTAHNIAPHEPLGPARDATWRRYFDEFRRRVDLVISLSAWAERTLMATYPDLGDRRRAIIAHPHYRTAYPKPPSRSAARAALHLARNAFVVLATGNIRPSKGIAELAERFTRVARSDETLVIAGACDDHDMLVRLKAAVAAGSGSVVLRLGRVPDAQIGTLVSAADLSIYNFRSILNSGSVLLSLSFNTPVCAPELGSLKELSAALGPRWFLPLGQPLSDEGLRAALDCVRSAAKDRHCREAALLDDLDPVAIAAATYAEYAALVQSARSGATRR
jgi:beta-1,4-mannosyltransferase